LQEGGGAQVAQGSQAPNKRARIGLAVTFAVTLLADQVSKAWATVALAQGHKIEILGSFLQLRLVRNPGSAFGLFAGSTIIIFTVNLVILTALTIWAVRNEEEPVKLGLVIGGGMGNLVDRLARPPGMGRGEVVDFIYLSFWPTFNIADASIVIGVLLLLAGGYRKKPA